MNQEHIAEMKRVFLLVFDLLTAEQQERIISIMEGMEGAGL